MEAQAQAQAQAHFQAGASSAEGLFPSQALEIALDSRMEPKASSSVQSPVPSVPLTCSTMNGCLGPSK